MIQKSTVLVLGAGASKPYYFPVGQELLQCVADGLISDGALAHQLRVCGCEDDEIETFREELVKSQQPSVDAFLEHRREFLDIGKLAIAAELAPREQEKILYPTFKGFEGHERRWYDYLFGMMRAGAERFELNKLSVVTFNYDRSFEQALILFLKHTYGLSDEKAKTLCAAVPIVHVHGKLGGPRYKPPTPRAGQSIKPNLVRRAASGIKVPHETFVEDPEFAQAHRLLQNAEFVCFLGFAYHEQNVSRLRLGLLNERTALHGTAFGLRGAEKERAKRHVGREISLWDLDALDFLRGVDAFS